MSDSSWIEIQKELTVYAAFKCSRLFWRKGFPPDGKQAIDMAKEAITDTWTGARRWNPDSDPDLLDYLKSVVDSKVSNLVRSNANRNILSMDEWVMNTACRLTPDGDLERREQQQAIEHVVQQIRNSIKDSPELRLVLHKILEGKKAAQIATEMNVSASVIYRHTRTIKRRALAAGLKLMLKT